MYPPIGWQNISPTRRKDSDRISVTAAVQEIHPTAVENQINDNFLAYWVNDTVPRLVGIAWGEPDRWHYTVMSQVAYRIGVQCAVYPIGGNRYRILPCKADDTMTIRRQIMAHQSRLQRLGKGYRCYQEAGGWFVEFVTSDGLQKFGPYVTAYTANKEVPKLLQLIQRFEGTISETDIVSEDMI